MMFLGLFLGVYLICQRHRRRREERFSFSPLPQKISFFDDEDGQEKELFKSPLRGIGIVYSFINLILSC